MVLVLYQRFVNQLSSCPKSRNFLQAAENLQIAAAQTNKRTRSWPNIVTPVRSRAVEVAQSAFTGQGPGTEHTSARLFHLGI